MLFDRSISFILVVMACVSRSCVMAAISNRFGVRGGMADREGQWPSSFLCMARVSSPGTPMLLGNRGSRPGKRSPAAPDIGTIGGIGEAFRDRRGSIIWGLVVIILGVGRTADKGVYNIFYLFIFSFL